MGGVLLEGAGDGTVLSLLGRFLSRESIRVVTNTLAQWRHLVSGVQGPGALVVHVDVELSLSLVDSKGGIVDSDDITNSVDNWEILEPGGVDDDLSPVLFVLGVQSWVDNLDGADESVAVDLVGEGSISDDTVEVHWVSGGQGSLVELNVLVLCMGKWCE